MVKYAGGGPTWFGWRPAARVFLQRKSQERLSGKPQSGRERGRWAGAAGRGNRLGQTSTYNTDIPAPVLHHQVACWALGAGTDGILGLVQRVEEKEHKFRGFYLCRALAGPDTALWDMRGRPIWIRAYTSSMMWGITPEEEAARFVRLHDAHGCDAFKWRVGTECGRYVNEWPVRTEAVILVVSKALGDGTFKLVDGHSGFSVGRIIEVGKRLEGSGIGHFEGPVPYWGLSATKLVTDALALDVTGGEQDCEMAVRHGLPVTPH